MKALLLHPLRLALIALPAYNLYIFSQGEGAGKPTDWWIDQAGFIAWALGSYGILLLASFMFRLNWIQLILFCLGTAGLGFFYLTEDIYKFFLSLEYFQDENKKMLPVVPYAITVLTLLLSLLFKSRRGRPAAKD